MPKVPTAAVAVALLALAGVAHAGPADAARTHFQAIASGGLPVVMRAYARCATC